jgi:hypothetical protein
MRLLKDLEGRAVREDAPRAPKLHYALKSSSNTSYINCQYMMLAKSNKH